MNESPVIMNTIATLYKMCQSKENYLNAMRNGFNHAVCSFPQQECAKYVIDFFVKHGAPPSFNILLSEFSEVMYVYQNNKKIAVEESMMTILQEPVTYYLEGLKKAGLNFNLSNMLMSANNSLLNKDDASTIIDELMLKAQESKLLYESEAGSGITKIQDHIPKVLKDVEAIMNADPDDVANILGVDPPWDFFKWAFVSFEKGRLTTVAARTGVGKTWMVLLIALHAHEEGNTVLIGSYEVTSYELSFRIAAIKAGIEPLKMKSGKLTEEELEHLKQSAKDIREDSKFYLMGSDILNQLELMESMIASLKPHLIVIDAFYLYEDPRQTEEWKTLHKLTKNYKRICTKYDTHIVISGQLDASAATAKTADASKMKGAKRIAQDSDNIIILAQALKQKRHNELDVIIEKARGGKDKVACHFDWDIEAQKFVDRQVFELDRGDEDKTKNFLNRA